MSQPLIDLAILRAVEECGEDPSLYAFMIHLKLPEAYAPKLLDAIQTLCKNRLVETWDKPFCIYNTYRLTAAGRARLEKGS